ncbi:uncharacterized protein LOC131648520 [Vicia villosa]|uniref:uncharacterized protein LOC131648520 n=1 Tax=Vicia villosa TaxID=3911 RepID=UPI00273B7640|nr:uncharacterized protein LOC131648520 [Vicia villosa]
MAQFMEALINVTKGQDDLRVLVENSRRVENGGHSRLFDDVSRHSADGAPEEAERYRLIEERLRAVEGKGVLGMDINDLGLVPGVRIAPKFKDSLAGASLEWYVQLERTHIHSWRDLVEAFIKLYQYNVDMAPNRTQLQSLVQGSKESFKEYAQKWRELAARVQPPMTEREMIDMFTSTLSGHYYLACSASANFSEMFGAFSNTPSGKKQAEGYARRKEGNADAIYGRRGSGRSNSQVNAVMIPVPQQQQHQQGHHSNTDCYPPRTRPHRKIDPIPMTYAQMLQHLLKIEKITLRDAPSAPDTQSPNYNANARCTFHSGAAGHDTERCIALKNKVQDMLDQKIIQFTPTPNIVNNPMPAHGGSGVNAVGSEEIRVVSEVSCLTFPLVSVKQHLVNSGIFPGCGVDCENCKRQPEGCADLKSMVQRLIDEGPLQFYRRLRGAKSNGGEVSVISIPYEPVAPICIQVPIQIPVSIPYEEQPAALMITVPGPIPYESEKAVPWHYGSDVYYYGTREESEPSKEKLVKASVANTDNFAGTGRITRSGRMFSPQPIQNNADALAKAKGKKVVTDVQNPPIQNGAPYSAVSSQDVEELLRIIRKSDYKVVEQLALMRIDYAGVELRPSELVVRAFDGSRRYVFREIEGEIHETPFQAFEAVNAVRTPPYEITKPETIMSSLKDAQVVVETGRVEGWGQVIDVHPKFDKNGLGFNPGKKNASPKPNILSPVKFVSGGVIQDGQVHAIVNGEEMDSD